MDTSFYITELRKTQLERKRPIFIASIKLAMEYLAPLLQRQWFSSSAKAMVVFDEDLEEDKYILAKYNGDHSDACVPNSTIAQVKAVREKKKTVLKPTQKPSHVYAKEVDSVRATLGEGFREEFDQLMPTQTTLNPSIYAWKRSVIPPNPEEPVNIDTSCPFFLTSSGENICKASVDIGGDPRRRLLLLTTDKVMKKGLRFAERGVMDATFDVSII